MARIATAALQCTDYRRRPTAARHPARCEKEQASASVASAFCGVRDGVHRSVSLSTQAAELGSVGRRRRARTSTSSAHSASIALRDSHTTSMCWSPVEFTGAVRGKTGAAHTPCPVGTPCARGRHGAPCPPGADRSHDEYTTRRGATPREMSKIRKYLGLERTARQARSADALRRRDDLAPVI
jgi:hypothetical protein